MLIEPKDSISNVLQSSCSSKRSKGRLAASSVSSTRLKFHAERAALLPRAEALKEKHALELEKAALIERHAMEKVQSKLERMYLEMDLAASDAKLKILEKF